MVRNCQYVDEVLLPLKRVQRFRALKSHLDRTQPLEIVLLQNSSAVFSSNHDYTPSLPFCCGPKELEAFGKQD